MNSILEIYFKYQASKKFINLINKTKYRKYHLPIDCVLTFIYTTEKLL